MQIKDLMAELLSCDCHFVRCLKPNDRKEKKLFIPMMTLQQIKYMGILDTIKVRKDSYPIRRPYERFYEKYEDLSSVHSKKSYFDHIRLGSNFKTMTQE